MSNQEATGNTTKKTKNDQEERDKTFFCNDCDFSFSLANKSRHMDSLKHKGSVFVRKLQGDTPLDDLKRIAGTPGQAARGSSVSDELGCQNSSGSSVTDEQGLQMAPRSSVTDEREYTYILERRFGQPKIRPKFRSNLKKDGSTQTENEVETTRDAN